MPRMHRTDGAPHEAKIIDLRERLARGAGDTADLTTRLNRPDSPVYLPGDPVYLPGDPRLAQVSFARMRDDQTDLDGSTYTNNHIRVLNADGDAVHRDDITFSYTTHEGLVAHGLLNGDRLYVDGVLCQWEMSTEDRIRELARLEHARSGRTTTAQ